MSKRIAFVDYRLDNFHANVFLNAIRGELKDRGYDVTASFALHQRESRDWAEKKNVPYFASTEEMNEHVDCYMILAPSNPEVHLDLCRRVLPFGKAAYVDKTFAPDLATAKEIFELADQHRTPVQTTSALRYTRVQQRVAEIGRDKLRHMIAWGGGSSFGEYAIHPVELVISCMGPDAQSLMRRGTKEYSQLLVNFTDDRTGVINVYTEGNTPFAAAITSTATTEHVPVALDRLFIDTAAAILDFFDAETPNIDRAESLMIRRILDAAEEPEALSGFVKL